MSNGALTVETAKGWVFGRRVRFDSAKIKTRAEAIFRFLNLLTFLEIYAEGRSLAVVKQVVIMLIARLREKVSHAALWSTSLQGEIEYAKRLLQGLPLLSAVVVEALEDLEASQLEHSDWRYVSRMWGHA